ncbi:MAG: hypothetical protein DCC67_11995 [Planctomycetota bacterium]|nr:MAG: hypothetical protein DCC67_11995 [Planctomycetota bacterium]
MEELLLGALIAIVFGMIAWAMRTPDRMYQFPSLCAFVYAGFILPHALSLYQWNAELPAGALERVLLFAILALGTITYAFHAARGISIGPATVLKYDSGTLLCFAYSAAAIGLFFFWQLHRLGIDTRNQAWTGLPVVYLYFGKFFFYGFAILLLVGLHTRNRLALACAFLCGAFALARILIYFRRSELLEFLVVAAFPVYFHRRWRVPRAAILTAAAILPLLIASGHEYRYTVQSRQGLDIGASTRIDYLDNFFTKAFRHRKTEIENAAMRMAAIAKTGEYTLGLHYWNDFIQSVIPGTLVGPEFKRSLYLPLLHPDALAERAFSYVGKAGATNTGFVDAYWAFGYAGVLVFGLVAAAVGCCYKRAVRGDIAFQFYFVILSVDALHIITHTTSFFLFHAFHVCVLTAPVFWYAMRRRDAGVRCDRDAFLRLPIVRLHR